MSAPRPRSTDMGAALAGLVLGGSVLFLVMLTIVWLTNAHFASEKAKGEHGSPPAAQTAPATSSTAPAAAPAGH